LNAAGKLRLRRRRRCGRRPALEMVVFEQVHAGLAVNASTQHKSSRTRNATGCWFAPTRAHCCTSGCSALGA
jgi:hypothetical protein